MKDETVNRLIDFGTVLAGIGCYIVGTVVPPTSTLLIPLGGMLVGVGGMSKPSEILARRRERNGNQPPSKQP